MDIIPSEEKFIELVGKAYNPLKVTLIKLKSIFLIEDYVDSIKVLIIPVSLPPLPFYSLFPNLHFVRKRIDYLISLNVYF